MKYYYRDDVTGDHYLVRRVQEYTKGPGYSVCYGPVMQNGRWGLVTLKEFGIQKCADVQKKNLEQYANSHGFTYIDEFAIDEDRYRFAVDVKTARKELEITRGDLARAIGIPACVVKKIEDNGTTRMSKWFLPICEQLGLDPLSYRL